MIWQVAIFVKLEIWAIWNTNSTGSTGSCMTLLCPRVKHYTLQLRKKTRAPHRIYSWVYSMSTQHINIITARKRSLGQGNIFTPVCHSVHRGVACVVAPGGGWGCVWLLRGGEHAWLLQGACMVLFRGACVVLFGGCVVLFGGMHGFIGGGHAWFFQFFRIQWDTVNERAVRILLECILVLPCKNIPQRNWYT